MPGYRLAVTFVDGSKGVVDLSLLVEREDAGLFTALREPSFFARAYLELGVVTWPNGAVCCIVKPPISLNWSESGLTPSS